MNEGLHDMRIAIVTPELIPVVGGISSYTLSLISELSRKGEIAVVTPGRASTISSGLKKIIGESHANLSFFNSSSIDIDEPFMRTCAHQLGLHKSLKAVVSEYRPDLIHFTSPHSWNIGWRPVTKVPCVTTVHSLIESDVRALKSSHAGSRIPRLTDYMKIVFQPLLAANEGLALKSSGTVICVSPQLTATLAERLTNRIATIDNGVNTRLFSPDIEPKKHPRCVSIVSRLIPGKGIETAIEVCRNLVDRGYSDIEMKVVGCGNISQYIALSRSLGLSNRNISFQGCVPYEEMPRVYASSTAFLCPSFSEGLPMSLIEAMSCGVPVVATRTGAIPSVVDDGLDGYLVSPGDSALMTERLIEILSNQDLEDKLGKAAREKVESRYSSSLMAERTIEVYRKTLMVM